MEYVKMPELLPVEAAKALAGNLDALKDIVVAREAAAYGGSDSVASPRKVKFILFLNNVVIINENAVAADNYRPQK
jgi:hypothetical protein